MMPRQATFSVYSPVTGNLMRLPLTAPALLAASLPLSTQAQDLSGMAGVLKVNASNERTFVAAISYTLRATRRT